MFEVPLDFILDAANHDVDATASGSARRFRTLRGHTTASYRIWGATAAMLVSFRDLHLQWLTRRTTRARSTRCFESWRRFASPDGGCPWDREQTFATIAPYTHRRGVRGRGRDRARRRCDELEGELGDLLFQVVFHARMAEEAKLFDFGDVVAAICDKLVRRHPHVFGDEQGRVASADDQTRRWEEIKREERDAGGETRVLATCRWRCPALARAAKLGKRAATVGFDWPDVAGVRAKLTEELGELDAALAARVVPRGDAAAPGSDPAGRDAVAAEIGDLLFTIANLCRHLDLDPEACVRGANARFERRFDHVEARVRAAGGDWGAHNAGRPGAALARGQERHALATARGPAFRFDSAPRP